MNNGYLGMVRQWQELFWDRRYSHVDMGTWPDFVKLAEAYGATGMRLTDKTTLVEDMRTAIDDARPGGGRRPRHARGEHVPDDRARRRRAGHGGVSDGRAGTKELLTLEELEASAGVRTGRKHILSILVENKPGVLTRIAGLFARRGFNIDTLAVGPTDDETLSRITLTLDGAMHPIDQVTKQLHKLVNVIKIRDLEPAETVARELALFKVTADGAARGEVMQIVEIFRGKIIDVTRRSRDRRGHRHVGEDRGVRAHGAPVRPGRDGAHRRDRDLARARRDLTGSTSVSWGRGTPLVLLHAGPGLDGSIFLPGAEALAADYRLLLVDLPGNGRSPDPEEWTLAAHARALEEFVRGALGDWTLLGHSFGGFVALQHLADFPGSATPPDRLLHRRRRGAGAGVGDPEATYATCRRTSRPPSSSRSASPATRRRARRGSASCRSSRPTRRRSRAAFADVVFRHQALLHARRDAATCTR